MKTIKTLIILIGLVLSNQVVSQTIYIDVLTPLAMQAASQTLKSQQEETNDELNKIQKTQLLVQTQIAWANDIQNKLYKGLKEVSGTINNGLQILQIIKNLEKCYERIDLIVDYASENPEYTIFSTKAVKLAYNKAIYIYTHAQDIIMESDTNLMTAGDRKRVLRVIEKDTYQLSIYLYHIYYLMKRAKRKGFWNMVNPLNNYIQKDTQLIKKIMKDSREIGVF